jgi:hypothetical protein
MKKSDYKAEIEKIYKWEITDRMLDVFIDLAKETGSGKTVLDEWRLFQSKNPGKSPDCFREWFLDKRKPDPPEKSTKQTQNDGLGLFKDLPWRE